MVGRAVERPILRELRWTTRVGRSCAENFSSYLFWHIGTNQINNQSKKTSCTPAKEIAILIFCSLPALYKPILDEASSYFRIQWPKMNYLTA